jgi:acetyl esterase
MRHHLLALLSASVLSWSVPLQVDAKDKVMKMTSSTDSGTMQRANSEMRKVLTKLDELGPKPIDTLTPEEARKQPSPADAVAALLKEQGKDPEQLKAESGVTTQDSTYPGASGDQIPARIYKPANAGSTPLPLIVYIHGGGWVIADINTYDATPRALAKKANAIVVSVHYRQAPEAKFPASHDDTIAAYKWALSEAGNWGADNKRVALVGESAGGNMAVNVAIAARDQSLQMPVHVVAVYPVAGNDMTTSSYKKNEKAKPLGKAGMEWFFKQETNSESDANDPRLDLVGTADLKGLPPTTIITDDIDPLMTEGQALGKKMRTAGVKVQARNYSGVTHEFFGMNAVIKKADDAQNFAVGELKKAFGEKTAAE